jgi:TRAP-type mannitol/chloroaromatic compound transport system substrate-binding protein
MTDLKRRRFLRGAGLATAGVATTLAAPAIAQSTPDVKWRLAASWPKSLDTLYGAAEHVCKIVAEMTDNKFQIQPFAAGELVPGLQVLDAVQNGTVECGHTAHYYYFGKNDAFIFGTAAPFGMNSRMQNAWWMHGGGTDLMNEFLKEYNVVSFPAGNTNAQMGGWFRKEVNTVEDLKGLKFRIAGFAGKVLQQLGVVPQQLAAGDIYPALEKGTLDAAEWVGPYDDEKLGFVKVAKYYYYPGWWEANGLNVLMINREKWESLPKAYKAVLSSALRDANLWTSTKYDTVNPAALKRLVSQGAQLKAFPPEVMDACYKATVGLCKDISEKNPTFKNLYDSQQAFQNDGYLWTQVADYTMDSYMIRYRNSKT